MLTLYHKKQRKQIFFTNRFIFNKKTKSIDKINMLLSSVSERKKPNEFGQKLYPLPVFFASNACRQYKQFFRQNQVFFKDSITKPAKLANFFANNIKYHFYLLVCLTRVRVSFLL